MHIITPEQGTEALKKDALIAKKLISKNEVEVVRIRIEEGGTLPMHTTPVEVFFYINAGNDEIEIGQEREKVEAGSVVESPKNIPHALHNPSDDPFEVLVVKTPKPSPS